MLLPSKLVNLQAVHSEILTPPLAGKASERHSDCCQVSATYVNTLDFDGPKRRLTLS